MEQIIVLGATGNVGTAVLKNLQNRNVQVFAGVHSEKGFEKVSQFGAKPIIVNFNDQESLNEALKGKDRVFLVTPIIQNADAVTQMVINAAKLNNLKHIVRSSGAGADANGQIQLARWAGLSEDVVKSSDLNYTIIRPYSFLQNLINFHGQSIQQNNGFFMPVGDAKLSLVDVNDIGEIAAIVMTSEEHYKKTYELSGLTYTYEEIAATLSKVVERKISYIDIPEENARESMLSFQMSEWLVDALMELSYITKQGWTAGYSDDFKNLTCKEYTSSETFFENNKKAFL